MSEKLLKLEIDSIKENQSWNIVEEIKCHKNLISFPLNRYLFNLS